jgi:EAL domain-containing protein (putative c-di-GMP-specific phosphodiesterase class I)
MVGENGQRILPGEFLPTAERYQIMPEIDRWVVRNAFEKIAAVRDILAKRRALFAINLSGQSIGDESFLHYICSWFEQTRTPENLICFEITETAAVANLEKARRFIEELRFRGCRFSLDDFGAGLSSFAYLKSLPVDYLKIDGNFVRDIDESRVSESMVVAIQQVARIMELETIAEGVESDSTCSRLQAIGVDFVQGFGIDRPIPLDALLEQIAAGEPAVSDLLAPVGRALGA